MSQKPIKQHFSVTYSYQLYFTADQLEAAYPEIEGFFETKRKYDPDELFRNTFYNRYAPAFEK